MLGLLNSSFRGTPCLPRQCKQACTYVLHDMHSRRRACVISRRKSSVCCASSRSPEAYVTLLQDACQADDWLKAFELITEAKVLDVQLPQHALEATVQTLARGGQAQRSADLLGRLFKAEASQPSADTILAVLEAWAAAKDASRAKELLEVLEQRHSTGLDSTAALGRARNKVVRVFAATDAALEAADMLDGYLKLQSQDKQTLILFDTAFPGHAHR
ncbi:hypothetical protein DUNSADRAFT_14101 [Dunaliella salina]|uniref:Uncharacterized protein n=1 Tax=Dunaliella salina TaxID=3046 RepID=A0ABQ7G803_DUNSA|nr:hypothetical protein DUNSADRAFT_14101 [Dunaliella salina]|eukprot:KAF5830741.1 hypothetical protein DUNSADRAFT_14101 [Dunaliella salina]